MKIIRFAPTVLTATGEKLIRVLTFANGSYALHFADAKGQSKLSLFDRQGALIRKNANAESAYVFKNGSYILLYEPTNATAGVGCNRLRRMYRMFTRDGRVVFNDIESFTPLYDDWVILFRDRKKELYDDKCHLIDQGRFDFVKFDGGYARISGRDVTDGNEQPVLPGDLGRWLSYNHRMKKIVFGEKRTYDWTICNEDGSKRYCANNGLAVFGGGYLLTLHKEGKIFFHYPDGMMGTETTLYSGAGKNFACLVNLSLTKMGLAEKNGQPAMTYCYSREVGGTFSIDKPLADVHEFSNGNFSALHDGKLCFFYSGSLEPEVVLEPDQPYCFLPDGRFWNASGKVLYNPNATPFMEGVDGVIDLGGWYLVEKDGMHAVFNDEGQELARNVWFLRKVNGILALKLANGKIGLLHCNKGILPPLEEKSIAFAESAF